jgi:hypothetical protein
MIVILFIAVLIGCPLVCYCKRGCMWYEWRRERFVRRRCEQKLWDLQHPAEAAKRAAADEAARKANRREFKLPRKEERGPPLRLEPAPPPPQYAPPPQQAAPQQAAAPPPPQQQAPAAWVPPPAQAAGEQGPRAPVVAPAKAGFFARMRAGKGGAAAPAAQPRIEQTPVGAQYDYDDYTDVRFAHPALSSPNCLAALTGFTNAPYSFYSGLLFGQRVHGEHVHRRDAGRQQPFLRGTAAAAARPGGAAAAARRPLSRARARVTLETRLALGLFTLRTALRRSRSAVRAAARVALPHPRRQRPSAARARHPPRRRIPVPPRRCRSRCRHHRTHPRTLLRRSRAHTRARRTSNHRIVRG